MMNLLWQKLKDENDAIESAGSNGLIVIVFGKLIVMTLIKSV